MEPSSAGTNAFRKTAYSSAVSAGSSPRPDTAAGPRGPAQGPGRGASPLSRRASDTSSAAPGPRGRAPAAVNGP